MITEGQRQEGGNRKVNQAEASFQGSSEIPETVRKIQQLLYERQQEQLAQRLAQPQSGATLQQTPPSHGRGQRGQGHSGTRGQGQGGKGQGQRQDSGKKKPNKQNQRKVVS